MSAPIPCRSNGDCNARDPLLKTSIASSNGMTVVQASGIDVAMEGSFKSQLKYLEDTQKAQLKYLEETHNTVVQELRYENNLLRESLITCGNGIPLEIVSLGDPLPIFSRLPRFEHDSCRPCSPVLEDAFDIPIDGSGGYKYMGPRISPVDGVDFRNVRDQRQISDTSDGAQWQISNNLEMDYDKDWVPSATDNSKVDSRLTMDNAESGAESGTSSWHKVDSTNTIQLDKLQKEQAMQAHGGDSSTVKKVIAKTMLEDDEDEEGLETSYSRFHLRHRIRTWVKTVQFDLLFAAIVLANSIYLGVRIQLSMDNPGKPESLFIRVIEYVFTAAFTAELCLRVYAGGLQVFCGYRKHWYYLDLFVVSTSLFEAFLEIVQSSSDAVSAKNMSNARSFRVIRVIRLIKIIRIARVVHFVRALRTLVLSIMHTMQSVMWAFALLLTIIYMFALIFSQSVIDFMIENDDVEGLYMYWGTLPRAMFTLYKSISGGISWHDAVIPLSFVGEFTVGAFLLYISFVVFAVLNVITGVFCEAAIESARQDHEMMIQQHLSEKERFTAAVCDLFGVARDGTKDMVLSYQEFEEVLEHPHTKDYLASIQLDISDAWELFKLLDTDESAEIDVEEFVNGCLRLKGGARAIDIARLHYESKLRSKRLVKHMVAIEERIRKLNNLLQGKKSVTDSSRGGKLGTMSMQSKMESQGTASARHSGNSQQRHSGSTHRSVTLQEQVSHEEPNESEFGSDGHTRRI